MSNVKLSKAMSAEQISVLEAAGTRRDELHHRLLDEFPSLEYVPQILYHRSCFHMYTSKTNVKRTKVLARPETPRYCQDQKHQGTAKTRNTKVLARPETPRYWQDQKHQGTGKTRNTKVLPRPETPRNSGCQQTCLV